MNASFGYGMFGKCSTQTEFGNKVKSHCMTSNRRHSSMQHVAVQLGHFRNLKVKLRLLLETKNSCSLSENVKKVAFLTLYDVVTSDWGGVPKQYWYQ